ncbi:DoxX family protein [Eisenibacter elegans]|jgi:hypothetical protein|uniref:DoxX family protein n=1 Tax=Eisenibacter elegans TaxID=997 RepID=UPI00040610FF|nr:DoxX family protein [Eisenibacter elegans]
MSFFAVIAPEWMPVFLTAPFFVRLALALFLAILFLQSGLDKVFQWQGNLGWLKGHFAKTPFKNQVPLLLATITLFEVLAGLCSALGVLELFYFQDLNRVTWALVGAELSAVSLLMLFFGQRIAQDYPGAATLVPYFLVAIAAVWMFGMGG